MTSAVRLTVVSPFTAAQRPRSPTVVNGAPATFTSPESKSLKKKFKDKRFAAGCSREVIAKGAEMLEWELDQLMEKTILAIQACDESVKTELAALTE